MRILLTGAAGFVGSHALKQLLLTTYHEVVCPVTFTHKGMSDRIRLVLDEVGPDKAERVTIIKCDLSAPISSVTDQAFGHIDVVLNFASESHVDRSIEYPAEFIANNVALMCHLLDWARRHDRLLAFVQISTDEVYGPAPKGLDHREWEHNHCPSNPYAASKAAMEDICFAYWRTYGVPVVLTNTMNIIGESQDPEKFVPRMIQQILHGERATIHASPEGEPGSRFYLHADNQALGVLFVLDYVLDNPVNAETGEGLFYSPRMVTDRPYRFHIVGEREVNNLEMAEMIAETVGRPLQYELVDFHSSRPGHDLRYSLDGSKLEGIGWTPPRPLAQSLRDTVKWTLDHPEWLY